jgi:hypothetical protein
VLLEVKILVEDPCCIDMHSNSRDNEVAPTASLIIIMQEPTEEDEAFISTENEREDPNPNSTDDTFSLQRKAAKRTLPWDLAVDELELVSPQQAEDIRAMKRSRLEEPSSASTDEAWTVEENAKLSSAVANTLKKKWGKEYKIDWVAVAALVPGRTEVQCRNRWHNDLVSNIDPTTARAGKWTADEDGKLKDAIQTHVGKNWAGIAALVPGRTITQCRHRWHDVLNPNIDRANRRTGEWTVDEDGKLKDAVQTHSGKHWVAVAALVSGRTKFQCHRRWHDVLNANIDRTNRRTGKWAEDEDSKLKNAVQTHGGKNWAAVASLVPARTRQQCWNRWQDLGRSPKQN